MVSNGLHYIRLPTNARNAYNRHGLTIRGPPTRSGGSLVGVALRGANYATMLQTESSSSKKKKEQQQHGAGED